MGRGGTRLRAARERARGRNPELRSQLLLPRQLHGEEQGINNQLFRVIGCIQAYKGYPPPQPPLEAEYRWDNSRAVMGAWLISVSGGDLSRDGDVTVRFETALDPVIAQDARPAEGRFSDSLASRYACRRSGLG